LADSPKLIQAALFNIEEFFYEYYCRLAEAGKNFFDVLTFGDDFAGQERMLLSPAMWRRYFLNTWRRLFSIAHEYGMKAQMHSCGAVRPILGDLIDAGLDILEVVQVSASGMNPEELVREFGKHLTFYGGMDIQKLLPGTSAQQIREESQRLISIFGRDGRYIFTSTHYLMEDIPVENVIAMFEEARSYIPNYSV
jgi:uroporphyrinogen decarboxylase